MLAASERDEAKYKLHALRGVAANLGASRLAELARELERAINTGQENAALLHQFTTIFNKTTAAMKRIMTGLASSQIQSN
jgi:HPt (histidine-containing phosphotransfer) domain-containing protein